MKAFEEWYKKDLSNRPKPIYGAPQLEEKAFKAGMLHAAEIAEQAWRYDRTEDPSDAIRKEVEDDR